MLVNLLSAFCRGLRPGINITRRQCLHDEKKLRDRLKEKQIDKMVEDSFPASDPPSTY